MKVFNEHALVWAIIIAVFLIVSFGSIAVTAKVALDVLNIKLRVQIGLFGVPLINLIIYYSNCAIFIKTPRGKPKALSLKPMNKFETKFGFNAARAITNKNIYVNTLLGIDCNAYATSLMAGSLLMVGNVAAAKFNVTKKTKLNLNINATGRENKGKIFLRFKFKTSIAKIFLALLESI